MNASLPWCPLTMSLAEHRWLTATPSTEVWGRGTNRVIAMCKKHGVPPPTFEDRQGFLIVTFQAKVVAVTSGESEQTDDREASMKTSVKTSVKIMAHLGDNPTLTIPQLAEAIGLTARSVERSVRKLQEEGKLKRIGPDKGGHWEVVKHNSFYPQISLYSESVCDRVRPAATMSRKTAARLVGNPAAKAGRVGSANVSRMHFIMNAEDVR